MSGLKTEPRDHSGVTADDIRFLFAKNVILWSCRADVFFSKPLFSLYLAMFVSWKRDLMEKLQIV